MSDVRDILVGVSSSVGNKIENTSTAVESILTNANNTPKRVPKDTPKTTMEKLQQTLKNLEGETLTFAPSTLTKSGLKEKRKIKTTWERKGFRNNSRINNDGLVLYHWIKSSQGINSSLNDKSSSTGDYKYSKFNKKMEILFYNEEEYDLYLRDDKWSREDTDQLLELCKRYDTRFIIIADRFGENNNNNNNISKKSVEEIKERYYKIQSKLIELRTKPEEDPFHNPLTTYQFNGIYETERKIQSDKLFHLSKEEVAEEEQLLEKYNSIENHLLKHTKDSRSILKISQIAINNGAMKHYSQSDLSRGVGGSHSHSNTPTNNNNNSITPSSSTSSSSNKKNKRKHSEIDTSNDNKEKDKEGSVNNEENAQITMNSRQGARIESTLFDLHIGRPQNNFSKLYYNDLKEDILILLDLQKYFMEKRYHCEILKSQKEHLEKEIELLTATIPAEALALHVDEENETIQNSTDSESTTTNIPSSSTTAAPSSTSNRENRDKDRDRERSHHRDKDRTNSSSNHNYSHHHTHSHSSNNTTHHHSEKSTSTTPFQIYSGTFPEKPKEILPPPTEKLPSKSHKKSHSKDHHHSHHHRESSNSTTTANNSATPIISSVNIAPPSTPNLSTPIIGGITSPVITTLSSPPIYSTTNTTSPTNTNTEKKPEDSVGAFGNLDSFITQSLNNSIIQQKELSKKLAKEKRQQEKLDKKAVAAASTTSSSSKKDKKSKSSTISTPVSTSTAVAMGSPPALNINSPVSTSANTTTITTTTTTTTTAIPPFSSSSKKEKKPAPPKKEKKEKKEKEPKEKKERKKREPKISAINSTPTLTPIATPIMSTPQQISITTPIMTSPMVSTHPTTAGYQTNQMLNQVPMITPISISQSAIQNGPQFTPQQQVQMHQLYLQQQQQQLVQQQQQFLQQQQLLQQQLQQQQQYQPPPQ